MQVDDLLLPSTACVHFVEGKDAEPLIRDLHAADVNVGVVEEIRVETDLDFFNVLGTAMHFPKYFGDNWDAVHELLVDLSWSDASAHALVVLGAENFWKKTPRIAARLTETWLAAAEEWSHEAVAFHLVFVW